MDKIRIIGFGGSLRKGSYNWALLQNAQELLPDDAELELFDISGIPLFNQDNENDLPGPVREFKDAIRSSDAVLIASPEYNFSIPGYLKNAIDYASRPPSDNPFPGKPVAIMSASGSMLGGSRGQYHLRQVLGYLDMREIHKPEVFVSFADRKFDSNMKLIDEAARNLLRQLLENLVREAVKSRKA